MRKKKKTQPKKRKRINYDYVIQNRFHFFFILLTALFFILIGKMYNVMIEKKDSYEEELGNLTYATTKGEKLYIDKNINCDPILHFRR